MLIVIAYFECWLGAFTGILLDCHLFNCFVVSIVWYLWVGFCLIDFVCVLMLASGFI